MPGKRDFSHVLSPRVKGKGKFLGLLFVQKSETGSQ